MKFFVALSALLAVASAVPIYDAMPVHRTGILGGYGDIMDVYKTMKYMGGDMMGMTGMFDPMHMLWTGIGGMDKLGMGMYGPYRHYGLMGMGMGMKDWDFTGIYPRMY